MKQGLHCSYKMESEFLSCSTASFPRNSAEKQGFVIQVKEIRRLTVTSHNRIVYTVVPTSQSLWWHNKMKEYMLFMQNLL